jgi:hypothetical protein
MGLFKKPRFDPFPGSAKRPKLRHATLKRVTAPVAMEICNLFEPQEQARELITEDAKPAEYFKLLVKNRLHRDAVNFLAHGLPAREAVWWGCLCARTDPVLTENPAAAAALDATERWVADPGKSNREATRSASAEAGFEMPDAVAAWLALAAADSDGSLSPSVEGAKVNPDQTLTAHGVSGAVLLAASREEKEFKRRIGLFLDLGIQVADGPGAEQVFSQDAPSDGSETGVE